MWNMSEYNTQNVDSNYKHNTTKLTASRQHTAIDPVAEWNTQLANSTLEHHMENVLLGDNILQ